MHCTGDALLTAVILHWSYASPQCIAIAPCSDTSSWWWLKWCWQRWSRAWCWNETAFSFASFCFLLVLAGLFNFFLLRCTTFSRSNCGQSVSQSVSQQVAISTLSQSGQSAEIYIFQWLLLNRFVRERLKKEKKQLKNISLWRTPTHPPLKQFFRLVFCA